MEIIAQLPNLKEALLRLEFVTKGNKVRLRTAFQRIAFLCKRTAVNYAPVSPDKAVLKAKGVSKAKYRPPKGLMDSISIAENHMGAMVFVPLNSKAGRYAKRIHDERYSTWFNRGPGTERKGEQAREKFIERAILDNHASGALMKIVDSEMRKVVADANR